MRKPARDVDARFRAALTHFHAGRLDEAERLCRNLLRALPREASVLRLLAMICQLAGRQEEACRVFRNATRAAPYDPDAWADLGQCLLQHGQVDAAAEALCRALDIMPGHTIARHSLGLAQASRGERAAAEETLRQVLAEQPRLGGAWHHLAQLAFDGDPAFAATLMERAAALMPRHAATRMHHAALMVEAGRTVDAARLTAEAVALDAGQAATAESHVHLRRAAAAPRFGSRFALLDHALAARPKGGAVLEFGVRWGVSARYLAGRVRRLHGFDSLQGLPEAWIAGEGAGAYSTEGAAPPLPGNVMLHAGWFEETLPRFLADHPEPVGFVHVDCDIYSSTRTVLAGLADRLLPGAVLVFDEYHSYPGWRDHEYRAFREFVERRGTGYRYIGWVLFGRQAAVRLDG